MMSVIITAIKGRVSEVANVAEEDKIRTKHDL